MSPDELIEKLGYLGVFIGTFFEGETVVVVAGFLAERKLMSLPLVIGISFLGSYIGHLWWFYLGRTQGVRLLTRYPKLKKHLAKSIRLLEKYGAASIFVTQYLYGFRLASAVAFGITKIALGRFLILQALSCAIWATLIAYLGYYFGRAVETLLGRAANIEKYGLIAIAVIALIIWLYHRKKESKEPDEEIFDDALVTTASADAGMMNAERRTQNDEVRK